jgi:hypothetical protein
MADFDRLLNAIEQAESESYGAGTDGTDGTLSEERARALDAYYGKNTFPAPEGNSQVISRDVFESVEWILPSLTRIFAGADEVVKIEAVGPDDVKQAEQESLYLNHVVTQKNQWEQTFHDWAWDALVTKNAYCMAYWDDSKEVEYERYEDQSEDSLALLLEDDDIEVLEHESKVDEATLKDMQKGFEQATQQWQQMAMQAQQQGMMPPPQPQMPPPPMLHTVKIRRTRENGKVCLKVLPPERCLVHQSTPNYMLGDCPFFEYWEETTISKLRAMGLDVADDIDSDDRGYSETQEDEARDLYSEDRTRGDAWEPAMRKVRARMVWIRHDSDDDGIAEMQYALVVGRTVLHQEECNRIPVGSIVATPVPHRHIGMSIYDVTGDIQDTKTQLLRQGVDNLFHANTPRLFINDEKINLDDALVSRPGGIIRGMPGQGAAFGQDIAPIVIPNVFPQAMQGMDYMDTVKQGRTGVNNYFQGTDQNALNKTASGISQLTGAAAQRVEQIARMMAPSVEYLFSCVHEIILKHGHKQEVVQLKGEWATVDPSNWRKKRDLKIAVGLGSGNRDAMMAQLMTIFSTQMQTLPLGVTNPELIFNTLAELTKAAGFPTEAQFWKKPDPNFQPPPPPEMLKLQAETQAKQQELQLKQQEAQSEMQFKQQDAQIELEKSKVELQIKLAELEIKRQEFAMKAEAAQIDQQLQVQKTQHEMQRSEAELQMKDREVGMSHMHKEREFEFKERESQGKAKQGEDSTKKIAELIEGGRTVAVEKIKGPDGKVVGGRIHMADGKTRDVAIK